MALRDMISRGSDDNLNAFASVVAETLAKREGMTFGGAFNVVNSMEPTVRALYFKGKTTKHVAMQVAQKMKQAIRAAEPRPAVPPPTRHEEDEDE